MVKLIAQSAPAKINLFLRVVGRRPDGYHLIDSLFVPISLHDRVALELRAAADTAPEVALRCNVELGPIEQNLAVRAARAFAAEFGAPGAIAIDLTKRIPAGAGLGGGSSDAAAVLAMMAALKRGPKKAPGADRPRLERLALELGADVPFFLDSRPARVTGVGELIEPLKGFARLALVIAVPALTVSTAEVFRALKRRQWSGAAADADVEALKRGVLRPAALVNDLAKVAMRRYPEIARLRAMLEQAGAKGAAMTGSGGAVFGIFSSDARARRAAAELRAKAPGATVIAAAGGEPSDF